MTTIKFQNGTESTWDDGTKWDLRSYGRNGNVMTSGIEILEWPSTGNVGILPVTSKGMVCDNVRIDLPYTKKDLMNIALLLIDIAEKAP